MLSFHPCQFWKWRATVLASVWRATDFYVHKSTCMRLLPLSLSLRSLSLSPVSLSVHAYSWYSWNMRRCSSHSVAWAVCDRYQSVSWETFVLRGCLNLLKQIFRKTAWETPNIWLDHIEIITSPALWCDNAGPLNMTKLTLLVVLEVGARKPATRRALTAFGAGFPQHCTANSYFGSWLAAGCTSFSMVSRGRSCQYSTFSTPICSLGFNVRQFAVCPSFGLKLRFTTPAAF